MSNTFLALFFVGALISVILLARFLKPRTPGGYKRRFDDTSHRHDEAFPYSSTLYVGDGGSAGHAHHHHSVDCAHHTDAGSSCSDGGGGGDGGN